MRSKPDDADVCFSFAKAAAAADQPADAVDAAEKAMRLAQANADSATSSRIYQWLTIYRADRHLRD